ncbi:MAG: hypothetical protein AAF565_02835 [Pseudomonadota bacterium]
MHFIERLLQKQITIRQAIIAGFVLALLAAGYAFTAYRSNWFPVNVIREVRAFVGGDGAAHQRTLMQKVRNDLGIAPERFLHDRVVSAGTPLQDVTAPAGLFSEDRALPKFWASPALSLDDLLMIYGAFEFVDARFGIVMLDPRSGEILRQWPIAPGAETGALTKGGVEPSNGLIATSFAGNLKIQDFCGASVFEAEREYVHHAITFLPGTPVLWHWDTGDAVKRQADGTELQRFSIVDLMAANPDETWLHIRLSPFAWSFSEVDELVDWRAVALGTKDGRPVSEADPFHVNDLQPVPEDFPGIGAGEHVAISFRSLNTIAIVNVETLDIVHKIQEGLSRQHDIDFNDDGTITIFNNRNPFENVHISGWQPGQTHVTPVFDTSSMRHANRAHGNHTKYGPESFVILDYHGRVYAVENGQLVLLFENLWSSDQVLELRNVWTFPRADYERHVAACGG